MSEVCRQLEELANDDTLYATRFVDLVLEAARRAGASDVHLQPMSAELDVHWRLDGVLHKLGRFPAGDRSDIVARLKVLAGLLTYQTESPQEGRIRGDGAVGTEMRVSSFPTLHGERAVVRIFASNQERRSLADLEMPDDVNREFERLIAETSGALIVTGPAGSGKTTTLYASLRDVVRASSGGKSIVSLEDPIEVEVTGVAQSQINPAAGFGFATGLRSLMRQDPEVVMVGEIRDRETAEGVFQAAMTGHLVLTTFHSGSTATAIARLSDMGIEPYLLRTAIRGILCQRLVRRLCDCAVAAERNDDFMGLRVAAARLPRGCSRCMETGYQGRLLIPELMTSRSDDVGRAILSRRDAAQLESLAVGAGMVTLAQRARQMVEAGATSPAEIRRVFGFSDSTASPTDGEHALG